MKHHPTRLIRVNARYAEWLTRRARLLDISVTRLTQRLVVAALKRHATRTKDGTA